MSEPGAPAKHRLFFALWPAPELQVRLSRIARALQQELGGKATRIESIHLTLVFLGDVAASRLSEVAQIGERVRCEPLTLTLARSGCWSHNRIAWVAPVSTPPALSTLTSELQAQVRSLGFAIDERPHAPHITLVRKAAHARRTELLEEAVTWPVDHFVLVRSQLDTQGSRYVVVGRWPKERTEPTNAEY